MVVQAPAAVALDATRIVLCGLVLGMSVSIALARPRLRAVGVAGPTHAALLAIAAVLLTGSASPTELARAYGNLVRPVLAIAGIMIMTACVYRSGLLPALADRFFSRARSSEDPPGLGAMLGTVFVFAAALSSILNNDAMILLLTPLVLGLAKERWPRNPEVHRTLAYAVFAAIGVAPVVIANPINLLVADQAGIGFNPYFLRMAPAALVCWLITWAALALICWRRFANDSSRSKAGRPSSVADRPPASRPPQSRPLSSVQRRTAFVLLSVVLAYPIASVFHEWAVAAVSVTGAMILVRVLRARLSEVLLREVEWGILLFMLGAFAIGIALKNAGAVDALAGLYQQGSAPVLAGISAMGSAVLNNHPMTILNLLALQSLPAGTDLSYLIVLAGGDIGPRLLPTGSLAGLLWLAACRRANVRVPLKWFIGVGLATLVPALVGSVAVLLLFSG